MKFRFIFILCLLACVVNAQITEENVAWDYPVRYGTKGWETLKTVEEQFNAYNIPDDIIKKMSSEELIVMKYQEKKMLPGIYSLWDLSPAVRICLTIIEKENADLLKNRGDVIQFKQNLISNDIKFLDSIVELLKKIDT